ncbi:MAG: hypothetical protein EXS15_07940 [Phycisphaerales bacterium]|nr:hypothetical protein [Phycisphaerales bacterium]
MRRVVICAACAVALAGCYEKTIRVKNGATSRNVSEPDFNDQPTFMDEMMWGPVPKGQDPAAYYRKKNQPLSQ